MDKSGLGEQLLWSRLVVGLRGRREVRIDLDPAAIPVAAARVDGQALELEKDLDVMHGHLDAQQLAPMDVWGAVIDALQLDVAVGMEFGVLPLSHVKLHDRQELQSGFLDTLEALPTGDAKREWGRWLIRSTHSRRAMLICVSEVKRWPRWRKRT
jgi:hypothetical protein